VHQHIIPSDHKLKHHEFLLKFSVQTNTGTVVMVLVLTPTSYRQNRWWKKSKSIKKKMPLK
jgi:hypothetical protein